MSTLVYTVRMPEGATGGTWTLTPLAHHALPRLSSANAFPLTGSISAAGVLRNAAGNAAPDVLASVPGQDPVSPEYVLEIAYTTAAGKRLPGVPLRLSLVETSAGVVDVAVLVAGGLAQVATPAQLAALEEGTADAEAAADAANAAAVQALQTIGLTPWWAGDQNTINAAGRYRIMTGAAIGQVWERTAGGVLTRLAGLETVPWANISGKPATYPPAAHQHPWTDVTGKPASYPPAAHTHVAADITDLASTLAGLTGAAYVLAADFAATAELAVTGLVFAAAANKRYHVQVVGRLSAAANAGFSLRLSGPAGSDVTGLVNVVDTQAVTPTTRPAWQTGATVGAVGSGQIADNTNQPFTGDFIFANGATAGNVSLMLNGQGMGAVTLRASLTVMFVRELP